MDCKISEETRERIRTVWPDILEQIAAGAEIRTALGSNLVTRGQIRAYLAGEAGAREQWNDAKRDSADSYFDQVLSIAYNPGPDAAAARVSIDGWKWLAAKRNPAEYNDKAQLDVNVRSVDLTRIISDAQARLEASRIVGNAALLAAIQAPALPVLEMRDAQVIE